VNEIFHRKLKLKIGPALPGYRFKPGQCIVNSNWAEEFRQNKSTLQQFDGLKSIVAEVGVNKRNGLESYRLIYNSPLKGAENVPWGDMDQWYLKLFVESNFEICDYPAV
jgi:hypothetical protein